MKKQKEKKQKNTHKRRKKTFEIPRNLVRMLQK